MKMIQDIEVYNFWKYVKEKISFDDFKKQLMNKGYVIYSIESERVN